MEEYRYQDNTTAAGGNVSYPANTIPMPVCNHVCPACGRPLGYSWPIYPYPYPQYFPWYRPAEITC